MWRGYVANQANPCGELDAHNHHSQYFLSRTMSKLPPALLYLTIYNPSLLPTGPVSKDDEDAEEQAHILFYTARERAVSRDRMLRQVGLAKALVNFSRCGCFV